MHNRTRWLCFGALLIQYHHLANMLQRLPPELFLVIFRLLDAPPHLLYIYSFLCRAFHTSCLAIVGSRWDRLLKSCVDERWQEFEEALLQDEAVFSGIAAACFISPRMDFNYPEVELVAPRGKGRRVMHYLLESRCVLVLVTLCFLLILGLQMVTRIYL